MTTAYTPALLALAQQQASAQGWTMPTGVYLAVLGPSYEHRRRFAPFAQWALTWSA